MYNYFSITIRPRIEDFNIGWGKILLDAFDKIMVGYEHGENDTAINHLQVCLKLPCSSCNRTDNLRRKIKKLLDYDNENSLWMVVKKSNDGLYTLGYCMKESCYKFKGFTQDDIDTAFEHYNNKSNELKSKLGSTWIIKSINALPQGILDHKKKHPDFTTEKLLMDLFCKDLIPLSLMIKIKFKSTLDLLYAYTAYKSKGGDEDEDTIPSLRPHDILDTVEIEPKSCDKKFEDLYDKLNLDSYY